MIVVYDTRDRHKDTRGHHASNTFTPRKLGSTRDNTSSGSWCRAAMFTLSVLTHVTRVVLLNTLLEGIRQYDSSDTGHSDNVNIAAEHREPAEVLSQLDNTSNSPVNGEYKCC